MLSIIKTILVLGVTKNHCLNVMLHGWLCFWQIRILFFELENMSKFPLTFENNLKLTAIESAFERLA